MRCWGSHLRPCAKDPCTKTHPRGESLGRAGKEKASAKVGRRVRAMKPSGVGSPGPPEPQCRSPSSKEHYYKNVDLSRLGNPCCPGFPTGNTSSGQKGCPFVPGLATGTKGAASAHVAGAPFCPGWCYQPGQKVPFFHVFLFSILFLFQLYFCISIKLMYWNSVCMISTNIYIYIYSYLYNICPR